MVESEAKDVVQPYVVRLLLTIGGLFGAHRLYLHQIPEAFIFFSTAGVFLIGWLYDTFLFRTEVEKYNKAILDELKQEKEKYKKGKLQPAQSRFIGFSISRFACSVLYGTWIGILSWLACTVTFSWTDINHVPFIVVLAVGVSAGVYMVGQCGNQSRELSYIWIGAFSSLFLMIRGAHFSIFRALFFAAITTTVIGNRSAKYKKRRHSIKHFVFWCSLYCMLICVIVLGCSRKITDKQVTATRPGNFHETTTVGSLLRDRIFEVKRVHSFFRGNPLIGYTAKTVENGKKKSGIVNQSFWQRVWSGDLFDEWTGAAHLTKIDWIELTTVFIVDVLRSEVRLMEGETNVEPFRYALWRNYLIHRFEFEPLVSDEKMHAECTKWLLSNRGAAKEQQEIDEKDFGAMATRKGCQTVV